MEIFYQRNFSLREIQHEDANISTFLLSQYSN